ncbi:dihydropyrimidinase [Palleronia aestuarii]|uniref:Dihydropyrimidinase n=1 Tax=Palleronia aestuarii TaxID=568105 RepID=A0A2W7NBE4_9RHOB|nr:dihydropyrimidinase [Palleronia aestuarii]
MMSFDLVIRGGQVATAADTFSADIGIKLGRIAAIGEGLDAPDVIDAAGRLVLPGGIEAHAHIAQESATGGMTADDYRSGSISAAFGGNSCFVPFAAQHRGMGVTETLDLYDSRADGASVIDYGYHLIVADPTEKVLSEELPAAFARGVTSFKVFMTYDLMKVDDGQFLDILSVAKSHGALTMVHAENSGIIRWMTDRLLGAGYSAPRYHAISHPAAAEAEAINRAITLARFIDAALLVVHVSTPEGAALIARAKLDGAKIFAETCRNICSSIGRISTGPEWRVRSSCALLPCGTRPRRRHSGGICRRVPFPSSPPIMRRIGSTRRASSRRGRTRPSTGLPTGCPGSRCACRSSSPKG